MSLYIRRHETAFMSFLLFITFIDIICCKATTGGYMPSKILTLPITAKYTKFPSRALNAIGHDISRLFYI